MEREGKSATDRLAPVSYSLAGTPRVARLLPLSLPSTHMYRYMNDRDTTHRHHHHHHHQQQQQQQQLLQLLLQLLLQHCQQDAPGLTPSEEHEHHRAAKEPLSRKHRHLADQSGQAGPGVVPIWGVVQCKYRLRRERNGREVRREKHKKTTNEAPETTDREAAACS